MSDKPTEEAKACLKAVRVLVNNPAALARAEHNERQPPGVKANPKTVAAFYLAYAVLWRMEDRKMPDLDQPDGSIKIGETVKKKTELASIGEVVVALQKSTGIDYEDRIRHALRSHRAVAKAALARRYPKS